MAVFVGLGLRVGVGVGLGASLVGAAALGTGVARVGGSTGAGARVVVGSGCACLAGGSLEGVTAYATPMVSATRAAPTPASSPLRRASGCRSACSAALLAARPPPVSGPGAA